MPEKSMSVTSDLNVPSDIKKMIIENVWKDRSETTFEKKRRWDKEMQLFRDNFYAVSQIRTKKGEVDSMFELIDNDWVDEGSMRRAEMVECIVRLLALKGSIDIPEGEVFPAILRSS